MKNNDDINIDKESKSSLKEQIKQTKNEVEEIGGWEAFRDGTWLIKLIQKSFKNLYENSDPDFFKKKYPGFNDEKIADKITMVTARNAALLGAVVGATVSTDEIFAILTGFEAGFGAPANIAIAFLSIASEAVLLMRMQLTLVAHLAKLYEVSLQPDDPEDILTILAFAVGGSAADQAGRIGMKIGGKMTEKLIRETIKKDVLKSIQRLSMKLGIKILQRTIIKYAVPVVSMGIGSGWNYTSTIVVSKVAKKHFAERRKEILGK